VTRPSCPSSYSDSARSSSTERAANSSAVALTVVASSAIALAPFSQNSNRERCSGSGHAHPGQSKPSGWLTLRSALVPRASPCSLRRKRAVDVIAPSPPATRGSSVSWISASSAGSESSAALAATYRT
jgi:hypothetical protein